jgi:hypothetical protein
MEAQVYNEVLVARIHAQDAGHLGQGRAQQKSLPEKVNELIEAYFPTCRRSELNARAPLERPEARGGLRGRDLLAITDFPLLILAIKRDGITFAVLPISPVTGGER